ALRDAIVDQRAPRAGAEYVAGRVIVKFREEASREDREAAVARVANDAFIAARPSFANFDIVRIDDTSDAEAAAAAFAERPEVEYAQAAYRVHPAFVPNDPLYRELQWNLPLINLEPAWDIQPQAGASI